eukprot:106586-Pelagomonas_calceolata.AAC.5
MCCSPVGGGCCSRAASLGSTCPPAKTRSTCSHAVRWLCSDCATMRFQFRLWGGAAAGLQSFESACPPARSTCCYAVRWLGSDCATMRFQFRLWGNAAAGLQNFESTCPPAKTRSTCSHAVQWLCSDCAVAVQRCMF